MSETCYALRTCGRFAPYVGRQLTSWPDTESWLVDAIERAQRIRSRGGWAEVVLQRLDGDEWVDVRRIDGERAPAETTP